MEEIESKISGDVQKVIDDFDLKYERFLEFGKKDYHGDSIKKYLDSLIEKGTLKGWDEIAVACRRMIVCDRELDLEEGTKLMEDTLETFKNLKPEDQLYEAIRYANTCGLISYRSGNYSTALEYFKKAEDVSRNSDFKFFYFIPDMVSNRIRTEFEFFFQVLPDTISGDYIGICEERFINFIESYREAIDFWRNYVPDDKNKKLYLIYGHGMASLYHNLGETYDKALKKIKKSSSSPLIDFILKEKAKEANEYSLKWGEKIGDVYRQLQSKRALSDIYEEIGGEYKKISDEYEEAVLRGGWQRGKQMIYQKRIKNSKNKAKAQEQINKDDFKLDSMGDKIGILYNYNAIKEFMMKNDVESLKKDKNSEELTRLKVADKKIGVAEELRAIFSPLLYKRQVIKLIRDDVAFTTYDLLNKGEYEEALKFNEKYNCRSLIELSESIIYGNLKPTSDQNEKIDNLKKSIYKSIETSSDHKKTGAAKMSTILGEETNEDFLKLIFAYEDVLKQPVTPKKAHNRDDKNLITMLTARLKENTAVLKFLVTECVQKEKTVSKAWSFLIKRNRIDVEKLDIDVVELDMNLVSSIKSVIKRLEPSKKASSLKEEALRDYGVLHNEMAELSKKLELYNKLDGIKNLFIVPDGELFQLPLHLLGEKGQDLRRSINVYYSPSLIHLLTRNNNGSFNSNETASYLWLCSPTKDLCNCDGGNKPCLKKPDAKLIEALECADATLDSFRRYNPNTFTHVGFSTHCAFHDHLIEAYVSNILFHDSFLTPYDILLSSDDFSGVQTIFLGACSGGSCKYTDENEAVGLVTAFLAKKAHSVIAPLWVITMNLHDCFIDVVNKSDVINSPDPWNLATIFKNSNKTESNYLIPFVQYANLEIVEKDIKIR